MATTILQYTPWQSSPLFDARWDAYPAKQGPLAHVFQEFAFFSYDNEHKFHLDGRSMGYYYTPKIGADLSKGFEKFQKHNDTANEHLESLLKTIVDYERQKGRSCEADIVTWRGMITKIMATPFDQFNEYGAGSYNRATVTC